MKLIKLHVDSFGVLSNYDYTFNDGINKIVSKNGSGKSTLGSFIKVMFYGFDNEGKRDLVSNERKKYLPWQGGNMGGSIEFSYNGKNYLLSRTFFANAKNDVMQVIDLKTNKISNDFKTINIGNEIFGINSASYARTAFISQNEYDFKSFSDIDSKIGNLVDNTNDINNYDSASNLLVKFLNNNSSTRQTGKLYKMKNEITFLENEIKNKDLIEKTIDNKNIELENSKKNLDELNIKVSDLKKQIEIASNSNSVALLKSEYDQLVASINKLKEKISGEKSFFKSDVIFEESIREYQLLSRRLDKLRIEVEHYELLESENDFLNNNGYFNDIDDRKVLEIENLIMEIERLKIEVAKLSLTDEENKKIVEIEDKYNGNVPNIDEILELKRKLIEVVPELRKKIEIEKRNILSKRKTKMIIDIIILIVLALISFGLCFVSSLVGIGFFVSTLVVFSLIFVFNKKRGSNSKIESLEEMESSIKGEVKNLINASSDNYTNELYFLDDLINDVREYNSLIDKNGNGDLVNKIKNMNEYKKIVGSFFDNFNINYDDENYLILINNLKTDVKVFNDYTKKKKKYLELVDIYKENEKQLKEFIKINYNGDLVVIDEIIGEMIAHSKRYFEYLHELEIEKQKIDKFKSTNDISKLDNVVVDSSIDINELNKVLRKYEEDIIEINDNIGKSIRVLDDLYDSLNQIIDKENILNTLKGDYKVLSDKYKKIEKTLELLSVAKDSFSSKFANPISIALKKYFNYISLDDENMIDIDTDKNIFIKSNNIRYDSRLFSKGYQDLVEFSLRMSLVEAMFKDEKPLIILDDPFINLDQEKISKGMELLEEIASNYQILYLTCHKDRT